MLAYLRSEAELCGVLGHELGHITARHGVKQYSKNQVANIFGTVFSIFVGNNSLANLSRLASAAILRGYGREAELEADRVGAEYIAKIGYDPDALKNVIGVLKNQEEFDKVLAEEENREPYAYHGVFATHPDNDKRLQEVIKAAKTSIKGKKLDDNVEKYLNIIEGTPFGPGEGQGSSRGSSFYHTDLDFKLKFPKDWKIENLPTSVLGTSRNRETLIELTMRDLNRKITAKELIGRLYGDDFENGREIDVSEYKGYAASVDLDTNFGNAHKCRVAILYKNKKEAFQFLATTKERKDFNKNIMIFDDTISSLRKLKPSEKILGEPKRIVIHKVKKGDTFKSLSLKTAFSTHAENRLRVINNMFPSGEPKPGSLIKLVY
jgi:predicted Zn-dependent protease